MSESLQINKLITRVLNGEIRVPGFQRDFVWEPERAALLMDSIYKGYPFGSILVWRTRNKLKTERKLGSFDLPEPVADYPIDYVLDGQQRITSIFSAFQTEIKNDEEDPEHWLPIYYVFNTASNAQDSKFQALQSSDVDPDIHFPISSFFSPLGFAKLHRDLPEDKIEEIVDVQSRFSGVLIPVENFTQEDRASVAIVFERVNRQGVKLDTFQLLSAWTWSEEFDLQHQFRELSDELEDFGFDELGADNDLMLRCVAAILKTDPSPTSLIDTNGATVRDQFPVVIAALRRAVDFLRDQLHVRHIKFLPYPGILVVLGAYFAAKKRASVSSAEQAALLRWFWRTSFMHRYSGNPYRNILTDVIDAKQLANTGSSNLDNIVVSMSTDFYLERQFNPRYVATKTFILQVAAKSPRLFISGSKIHLNEVLAEPNRREYHHCYPKAFLARLEEGPDYPSDRIANFAFLSRNENNEISDRAPPRTRH